MQTISEHLLGRLKLLGVDHVFGIPGDYILPLFQAMQHAGVSHIAACNELNAGYAADGYARLRGLGVAAVTYGPGSLSIVNATAGAYAERVPLLVICGAQTRTAYRDEQIKHHVLPGRRDASLRVFEQVTVHAQRLDDPETAAADIDAAVATCLREQGPVYLELPQDILNHVCSEPPLPAFERGIRSDPQALAGAADMLAARIRSGSRTVLLPGHEVHLARIEADLRRFVERTAIPVASLFVGKPDFIEQHPLCIGAYQGAGSLPEVREFVEAADNVIFFGAVPSDFNLGGGTAQLAPAQIVHVLENRVVAVGARFDRVYIGELLRELDARLCAGIATAADAPRHAFAHRADDPYQVRADTPMTNRRLYDRIAHFIRPGDIVLADAGCAINATQLQFPEGARYLAACYWASIGMGFAASFGACIAEPARRVIALEGDGSIQMSAQELSSMARYGCTPIVFVVNNRGYTAERLIHDGPFNDIAEWNYHRLPEVWGGVRGEDVHTEQDLERALARAETHTGPGPLVIEVHLDPLDASEAFILMSAALRSR